MEGGTSSGSAGGRSSAELRGGGFLLVLRVGVDEVGYWPFFVGIAESLEISAYLQTT